MTEPFAYDLRVHAGREGEGRMRVPKIVEPNAAQLRGLHVLVEELAEAVGAYVATVVAGDTRPEFS